MGDFSWAEIHATDCGCKPLFLSSQTNGCSPVCVNLTVQVTHALGVWPFDPCVCVRVLPVESRGRWPPSRPSRTSLERIPASV